MCPTSIAPPMCCEQPLTDEAWAARTARLAAAKKAAYERMPTICPHCSSDSITPTFLGEQWECWDCWQVFEVQP